LASSSWLQFQMSRRPSDSWRKPMDTVFSKHQRAPQQTSQCRPAHGQRTKQTAQHHPGDEGSSDKLLQKRSVADVAENLLGCQVCCPNWGTIGGCNKGSRCPMSHDKDRDKKECPVSLHKYEDGSTRYTFRPPITEFIAQSFSADRTVVFSNNSIATHQIS
jgi:hypothetical protein